MKSHSIIFSLMAANKVFCTWAPGADARLTRSCCCCRSARCPAGVVLKSRSWGLGSPSDRPLTSHLTNGTLNTADTNTTASLLWTQTSECTFITGRGLYLTLRAQITVRHSRPRKTQTSLSITGLMINKVQTGFVNCIPFTNSKIHFLCILADRKLHLPRHKLPRYNPPQYDKFKKRQGRWLRYLL